MAMTFDADGNFTITGPTKIFTGQKPGYEVGHRKNDPKFGPLIVTSVGIDRTTYPGYSPYYYVIEPDTNPNAGVETV